MEFCPKCKSIMVPKVQGKKTVLVCRSCGYKAEHFSASKYKITESVQHKRGDILVVEGKKKKSADEERKYEADLYGTEMYEGEED